MDDILVQKIRNQLFKVYSATDLLLDESSLKFIEPFKNNMVGSLGSRGGVEYLLKTKRELTLCIQHDGGKNFGVFIMYYDLGVGKATRIAASTLGENLSSTVHRCIQAVLLDSEERR
jgi:hypothetical protein